MILFHVLEFNWTCCLENLIPAFCMGLCTNSQGRSLTELPDACDKYENLIQTKCVIYKQNSNKGKYTVISTIKKQTILDKPCFHR